MLDEDFRFRRFEMLLFDDDVYESLKPFTSITNSNRVEGTLGINLQLSGLRSVVENQGFCHSYTYPKSTAHVHVTKVSIDDIKVMA